MSEDANRTNDDFTLLRLEALREELLGQIWSLATETARSWDRASIRELVRLKVDIEALDFAMAHRPRRQSNNDGVLFST